MVLGVGLVGAGTGCDPPGEIDSTRDFRVMAERYSAAGKTAPYVDVHASFSCLGWADVCVGGQVGQRFDLTPEFSAQAPSASDPAPEEEDWCECVGGYELVSERGLILTFSGNRAVVEGEEASTANGLLEASLEGIPGIGWVVISNSERVFTDSSEDQFFVDVAGGFELTFADVKLRRGLFFSIIPGSEDSD